MDKEVESNGKRSIQSSIWEWYCIAVPRKKNLLSEEEWKKMSYKNETEGRKASDELSRDNQRWGITGSRVWKVWQKKIKGSTIAGTHIEQIPHHIRVLEIVWRNNQKKDILLIFIGNLLKRSIKVADHLNRFREKKPE